MSDAQIALTHRQRYGFDEEIVTYLNECADEAEWRGDRAVASVIRGGFRDGLSIDEVASQYGLDIDLTLNAMRRCVAAWRSVIAELRAREAIPT